VDLEHLKRVSWEGVPDGSDVGFMCSVQRKGVEVVTQVRASEPLVPGPDSEQETTGLPAIHQGLL
jgi:hypothetical protein